MSTHEYESTWQDTSPLNPKVGEIAACVLEERSHASSFKSSPFSLRGLLEICGVQASHLLIRRRKENLTGLEFTYNHMKRRSWSRRSAGVVLTVPKYIPLWLALFVISYVIFVFISIFLLNNHDENEYLILGLVFLLAFILSPRVGEMIQWVVAEIYAALYIYYILSHTHNNVLKEKLSSGLTWTGFFCLVIGAGVVIVTVLFYYGWPVLLREYLTRWTQFAGVSEEMEEAIQSRGIGMSELRQNNTPDPQNEEATSRFSHPVKTSMQSSMSPAYAMHEWLLLQHGGTQFHRHIRRFAISQYEGFLHLLLPWFVRPKISESYKCYFIGPMKDNLAHGLGAWFDSSPHGENLIGYFDHGIPIGPFESQENAIGGSRGSVLINVRMIYMTNVKGMKTLTRAKPQWGVACAECCISGNTSLDGYPIIRDIIQAHPCQCIHSREDACNCASDMMKNYYRHLEETKRLTSILVSVDNDGLKVQGHRPNNTHLHVRPQQVTICTEIVNRNELSVSTKPHGSHSRKMPSLSHTSQLSGDFEERFGSLSGDMVNLSNLVVDNNWTRTTDTEALVFIHGYNHMLVDALKRFGQFLAMAHLPSHLKTFVFNWPAGTSPLSYSLAAGNASSNSVQRDLDAFLQSLQHAGVRKVHFMIHSMGARLFLRAFPLIRQRFKMRSSYGTTPSNTVSSSVYHTKKDSCPMHSSVAMDSHLSVPITFSLHVASFTETHHGSEISNNMVSNDRENALDMIACEYPKNMKYRNQSEHKEPITMSWETEERLATTVNQNEAMELSTLIFLNPDYELDAFKTDFPDLYDVCSCITLYADKRDRAVQIAEQFCWYQPSLGHQTTAFRDTFEEFCDMDIIDASDLVGNMSFTYHAYWNINRTMVDDLYELIVFQRRASERRSRLFAVNGETFRFVTTPQDVNMI
eukprot:jgi/Galph1/4897/GphlegSOOS_G3590.1